MARWHLYRGPLFERLEKQTRGLNSHDYCMTFIQAMQRTDDQSLRRSYLLRLRDRLLEDPYVYHGKLRKAVRKELAKGNIANERL